MTPSKIKNNISKTILAQCYDLNSENTLILWRQVGLWHLRLNIRKIAGKIGVRGVSDQVICKFSERMCPPTFLLVCFSSLEESTYEIWKNVFYFTSKTLLVLENNQILVFYVFKLHDVVKCLSIKQQR